MTKHDKITKTYINKTEYMHIKKCKVTIKIIK